MSVGQSLPHDAAHLHVTGQARYIDDLPLPEPSLHLAFGLSPVARGRITACDLAELRSMPGVVLVMTADDLPRPADTSPSAHDEPLLAGDEVYYVGQPVFLVAATSHHAARRAVKRARLEFAETPPILSIEDALAADSRFEDAPLIWERGEALRALDTAENVITGVIDIGGQEHFYLEGQAAVALPQENGDMLIHSSTQHPTEIQHKVADALGLPMHAVRVETRRMGGGFGGKESQGNALAIATALVAAKTGLPCKMRYDRDDDMIITGKRHDIRIAYRAGFDADGRMTAVDFTHYLRCGWSQDLSLPVADRAMLHADNAYFIPHLRIESHRLRTNMQSATAFRGFGGPQGMMGIERVIEHIAAELGMDPLAVRQANYYGAKGTAPQTTHYGQPVTDFCLHEMTESLAETSRYRERRAEITAWNAENAILKRGIALTPVKFGISFTLTHLNQAGALVHVYQDGSVQLNHGGTEMGQGLYQKVAQVAAARFGIDMARVRITATDTGKVPNTSATAASSGSDLNGMAVRAACDEIVGRLSAFLAEVHQLPVDEVRFAEGEVRVGGAVYSFDEVIKRAYEARISLSATGYYRTPELSWDRLRGSGRPFYYFAYGAAVTEVVLDTLTGENRILRTDILHDAGRSLNPAIDIGQIEGGYVQGAGWLTMEELVWDDEGRLKTHAPSTYKIPAAGDTPPVFNVALWDNENSEETIYRSKAVGEPPFMLGMSAFFALSHAVGAGGHGWADLQAPATTEELMRALGRTKQ